MSNRNEHYRDVSELAGKLRMLMRNDPDLEQFCIEASDQMLSLEKEARQARSDLQMLKDELRNLMMESTGVAGLHKNGDVADWDWLIRNGGWLETLNDGK